MNSLNAIIESAIENKSKGYEYVTIPEAAARMGTNTQRIRYLLDNGKLSDNGCRGKARRVKLETDSPAADKKESHEEAKRRKTIAEANLIEQKSLEFQQQLFNKWSDEFYGLLTHAFAPFKNYAIELRLNKEQTQKLNELFDKCFKNLQSELPTISDSVNS